MGTPYVSQPSFSNLQKQQDELLVLQSIFGSENIRSLNSNSQQYEVSIEFDRLPTPFFLKHRTTTPVTFLPPIILTIQLHDQYPSDYSSTFLLTSFYMSKRQLQELCEKMDSLFIQNEVIVYQWIELIKDEVCGKSEFVLDEEDMDGEGCQQPCKETYHSETPCPQEIEAIRLKRQHENLQKQLVAIGFTPKDHEYLLKEILAYETIELNTRQCPNCRVKIEKNGGCSHMFCQRCRTSFTWEQALVPVQNTATTLLVKELGDDVDKILKHLKDSAAGETENLELLTLIENAVYTRTKPCPYEGCNQLNVMSSNSNNWIICISCRQSFCFRCGREFVSPVQHFAAKSKCKQYVQLKRVMD
ncbi:unnamed protein product [Didymodactylos carnosus]|uniref:RBR-type E3 ubiquitin transferase n=1 Tax=Didymodactylos carnosus TaxID=1234261 RepID=A0A814W577_9BILA|nr:unnamed protein product [Didymodactylos carnosus]CAF3962157.1 unnamed protein product [Didymodactylos carnosus]